MSDTTYVDFSAPAVNAAWLNDINNVAYRVLGVGGVLPTTVAQLVSNLGAILAVDAASTAAGKGAALFGYRRNVTGAVSRTVDAALGDNGFSVANAGVIGDNIADDTAAMNVAISAATILNCALTVPGGFVMKITTPLIYPQRFRIVGMGRAVENSPRFVSYGGTAIFKTQAGFTSESASFEHLAFDSVTTGTGTGIQASTTSYISQTTWRSCVFYGRLQYGIDGPIILNRFYDCDFGSYPADAIQKPFQAIRAVGTVGSFEPNANTFFSCVFRRSSAARTVEVATAGVQWNFYACDFEQNTCSSEVIKYDGGGSLNFYGGYAEANVTPYLIRTVGNLVTFFCNNVQLRGMHFNSPCTTAILKRMIAYPFLEITGCYGQLNCNVIENEFGALNQVSDVEMCYGNHFTAGTGSFGSLATVTTVGGYNARTFKAKAIAADTATLVTVNGGFINGVEKLGMTVTGANTLIATLGPAYPGGTTSYAGLVHITAMTGVNLTGNNNTASYAMHVAKDATASFYAQMSGIGQTTGGSSNQPSFAWSLVGNELRANPIGATTGTFSFFIVCTGDVKAT